MDDIFMRAGAAAWSHFLPIEALSTRKFPARWADAVSSTPPAAVLVAEFYGKVEAFAVIRASEDQDARAEFVGELDSFYCDPSVWGKGVGRALLAQVESKMREFGFSRATLWTAERNDRPRKIYEKSGWRPDGVVRHRSMGGVEFVELRYRRRL